MSRLHLSVVEGDTDRTKSIRRLRRELPPLVALIGSGAYIYYTALGDYSLHNWDEGVYANAARNTLRGEPFLVPHLRWMIWSDSTPMLPFLEKPPLVMWLQSVSMAVLGVNEFAVRFQSATFTIGTGVLIYIAVRERVDTLSGLLSGLVFYTTTYVHAGPNAGRFGATDMAHTFFGTLFVLLVLRAVERRHRRTLVTAGAVFGVATLVKGFAVLLFPVVLFPLLIRSPRAFTRGDGSPLPNRAALMSVGAAAAIGLPWFVVAWYRYPERFVSELIVEQVLKRAAGESTSVPGGLFGFMEYPYLKRLPVHLDPWIYFLPAAITVTAELSRRGRGLTRFQVAFLLWWFASIVAFFSVTGNHQWYIVPAYVPAAILVGTMLGLATRDRLAGVGVMAGAVTTLMFSFRLAPLSPLASPGTPGILGYAQVTGVRFLCAFVGGITALFVGPSLWNRVRADATATWSVAHDAVRTVAAVVLVIGFVVSMIGTPATGGGKLHQDQHELALKANAELADGEMMFVQATVTDGTPFFTYSFYADHAINVVNESALLSDPRIEYAMVKDDFRPDFHRADGVVANYTNGRQGNVTVVRTRAINESTARPG